MIFPPAHSTAPSSMIPRSLSSLPRRGPAPLLDLKVRSWRIFTSRIGLLDLRDFNSGLVRKMEAFRMIQSSDSCGRIRVCLRFAAFLLLSLILACGAGTSASPKAPTRQTAAAHNIRIGAAADSIYLNDSNYSAILGSEFSQLQAENEMKFSIIHPSSTAYDFTGADALVSFAQAHTMAVRGHTLVWHQQVPAWVTSGSYTPSQL